LTVKKRQDNGMLELNFPSRPPIQVLEKDYPPELLAGLGGVKPLWVGKARDYLVLLESPEAVRAVQPDFRLLDQVQDALCVIATAPTTSEEPQPPSRKKAKTDASRSTSTPDFVSRVFCPNCGVPEDPVTGSAHCTLVPYYADRLGRTKLLAEQVSRRGGQLHCALEGDRVAIAGTAALYLRGKITVPTEIL
jgi:predicted PhzF superfamily epimerase YddE/YHI9